MKIRIIARGIYGGSGELAVGSEHEISGPIPAGWADRVEVLDKAPDGAAPITNEAPTREAIAAMSKSELLEWLDAHGWDGDKRLGVEKLRDALTAIMFVGA